MDSIYFIIKIKIKIILIKTYQMIFKISRIKYIKIQIFLPKMINIALKTKVVIIFLKLIIISI